VSEVEAGALFAEALGGQLAREAEATRMLRLVVRLAQVLERPEGDLGPQWSETGAPAGRPPPAGRLPRARGGERAQAPADAASAGPCAARPGRTAPSGSAAGGARPVRWTGAGFTCGGQPHVSGAVRVLWVQGLGHLCTRGLRSAGAGRAARQATATC